MTVTGTRVPRKEDPRLLRRRAAGVVAAVSAAELPPGLAIPVRLALRGLPLTDYLQPVLAAGVVRYVGEPLAVVVAGDAYAAEDAAELADLDIEPLPPVLDAAAGARPGGIPLFPAGNVAADFSMGYGDADAAFGRAAHVAET